MSHPLPPSCGGHSQVRSCFVHARCPAHWPKSSRRSAGFLLRANSSCPQLQLQVRTNFSPQVAPGATNTLLEMKRCKSSKVCRTVASGQVLSHPDQQSWIPQVELREAPLLLLLLRPAVRHKRPGEERGEPAAALHRSGVCVQCCCVCQSGCVCSRVFVCVSHPPSLALSPPERRIPARDTPLSTNQRAAAALRSDTKQSV